MIQKTLTGIPALDLSEGTVLPQKGSFIGPKFRRADYPQYEKGFGDITRYYQQDCYVKESINKYTDLVMKGGITLESTNPQTAEWLQDQLNLMVYFNGQDFYTWLREIILSLTLYGNVFLLRYKTRGKNVGLEYIPYGYYVLPTDQVRFVRDAKTNHIKGVYLADGTGASFGLEAKKAWPVSKIIHLYYNRAPGGLLGVSHLFSVLEDIRMLRMLEDISIEMVYKNINPIVHAMVGANDKIPGSKKDIQEMDRLLKNFDPHSGYLVTNQFTELRVHGSESVALRPESLLRFFRERVMAGLGVSEVSLGNVGAANRSSTEAVTTDMHMRVEVYREHLRQLETSIFYEILAWGGFNPLANRGDHVHLKYFELEEGETFKRRNHWGQMYLWGIYGLNEVRAKLGEGPIDWEDTYPSRTDMVGANSSVPGVDNSGVEPQEGFLKILPPRLGEV